MTSNDQGLTLVEVLVSLALFLLALTMFGATLVVAQRLQGTSREYSSANDQAQLAFTNIDRQVRSGYVAAVLAGTSWFDSAVKIYTEAGGSPKCAMWVVVSPSAGAPAALLTTTWDPVTATAPTSLAGATWYTAATGLWNYVPPNNVTVFTSPLTPTGLLPVLSVDLRLNASSRADATIELTSVFTSRNVPRKLEEVVGTPGVTKEGAC